MSPSGMRSPFGDIVEVPLPGRLPKPRRAGVSMIIDKGLGPRQTEDLLDLAAPYIDYWKLPFGTAHFYPELLLREKIRLARERSIDIYPGGTYLEVAILQRRLEQFLDRALEFGFTAVEVSDGTVPLTPIERRNAIVQSKCRGLKVVSEVGKKDPNRKLSYPSLHRMIEEDLAAGVEHIIVEGRESGRGVGIYNEQGDIQEDELTKIVNGVKNLSVLLWETPLKSQQEEMIVRFGPNVNLGNIPPSEVMALEALRNGLRADTLKHCLPEEEARSDRSPS